MIYNFCKNFNAKKIYLNRKNHLMFLIYSLIKNYKTYILPIEGRILFIIFNLVKKNYNGNSNKCFNLMNFYNKNKIQNNNNQF